MKLVTQLALFAGALTLFLIVAAFALPWHTINWGKVEFGSDSSVTVTGQADTQERNQIARFNAGVTAVNDNKDAAVKEVNQSVETLIQAVKQFGIPDKDIQTQNLNVYQMEQANGDQRVKLGQWRVSNDISITLREVDRASELATLLTESGATNVYGPNFSLDNTDEAEIKLVDQAIANARTKAEAIAKASGRSLGKVISVTEGGSVGPGPVFEMAKGMGGGAAPVEPGSATVSKSVTVTFELK